MNQRSDKFVIINKDDQAAPNIFVIRRLGDGHYRLEESGSELQLVGQDTLAVEPKFDGKSLRTMPEKVELVSAYTTRSKHGDWYHFENRGGKLSVKGRAGVLSAADN